MGWHLHTWYVHYKFSLLIVFHKCLVTKKLITSPTYSSCLPFSLISKKYLFLFYIAIIVIISIMIKTVVREKKSQKERRNLMRSLTQFTKQNNSGHYMFLVALEKTILLVLLCAFGMIFLIYLYEKEGKCLHNTLVSFWI